MTNTGRTNESSGHLFYRRFYSPMIIALIVVIFVLLTMVIVVLNQVFHQPLPVFFVKAKDGKVMRLQAFDEPIFLPSTLLAWSSKAIVTAYTFDFLNYNAQINEARPFFTDEGWEGYQASLRVLIQDLVQKKLFVNGVVSGTPVIASQGEKPGTGYVWQVQIPFLVTFQGAETTSRTRFVVLLTIVKIPTNINPKGIGIDQIIMR